MSFTPIDITSNTSITPALLRHIETQYEKAIEYAQEGIKQSDDPLKAEILATNPIAEEGRIYFNSTTGKMMGYSTSWQEW